MVSFLYSLRKLGIFMDRSEKIPKLVQESGIGPFVPRFPSFFVHQS